MLARKSRANLSAKMLENKQHRVVPKTLQNKKIRRKNRNEF